MTLIQGGEVGIIDIRAIEFALDYFNLQLKHDKLEPIEVHYFLVITSFILPSPLCYLFVCLPAPIVNQ